MGIGKYLNQIWKIFLEMVGREEEHKRGWALGQVSKLYESLDYGCWDWTTHSLLSLCEHDEVWFLFENVGLPHRCSDP